MDEQLVGADLEAVVTLYDAAGNVVAEPGETCERVLQSSLGWLLEAGAIKRRAPASGAEED